MLSKAIELAKKGEWVKVHKILEKLEKEDNTLKEEDYYRVYKKCPHFSGCEAILCPLNPYSKYRVWYADEPICKLRAFNDFQWIKSQKKIANKWEKFKKEVGDEDLIPETYFTIEMLDRDFVIRKGIKGLDPDKDEKQQLREWLEAHPEKKEISEERKKELRERALLMRDKYKNK